MRRLAALFVSTLLGTPALCAGQQVALRRYTVHDGLPHNSVTRIFEDSRGFVWVATVDGVSRFDGYGFRNFGPSDGLPRTAITRIGETGGVLWFATRTGHVVRANDAPAGPYFLPHQIAPPPGGAARIAVPSRVHRLIFEDRARETAPLVVRGTAVAVSDVMEDTRGNLWIGTSGAGIFIAGAELVVNYIAAHELPDAHVLRIVESRDGRIYAMTRRGGVAELRADGVEAVPGSWFAPFHTIGRRIAQDDREVWWFRTDAGLFSAAGPALSFSQARLVTETPMALPSVHPGTFSDSRGWIWEPLPERGVSLCTRRGCIDYGQADGIGHRVTSMTEDAFGRVYFGTTKGLVRFDPRARVFSALPTLVKLAGSSVTDCARDRTGRIWVATTTGVSYIVPQAPRPNPTTQVYITRVGRGDTDVPLSPRGANALASFDTAAAVSSVVLEYAAPGASSDGIRYQHRLVPRDDDWSAPRPERIATYSSLTPGNYVFDVRAVYADGSSGPVASVRFHAGSGAPRGWWVVVAGALVLFGRYLRQLQRADGRRDLSGMPLRMFGCMEQEAEDGGRHPGAADRARLLQH